MYHSLPGFWAKHNVIGLNSGWFLHGAPVNMQPKENTSIYVHHVSLSIYHMKHTHTHIQTKALGNTCPKSMVSTWCPRPAIKTLAAGGEGRKEWLGWVGLGEWVGCAR